MPKENDITHSGFLWVTPNLSTARKTQNSVNLRMRRHLPRKDSLSSLPRSCCLLHFVQPAPGLLASQATCWTLCRHSKMNLKPLQSELEGGMRRRGVVVRMESKSGEVCSPLVCNFQNDSRTGAKVRESEALSTSASCGGEAWSPQDACLYKSTVSRACWRSGTMGPHGVGKRDNGAWPVRRPGTNVPWHHRGPHL